MCYNACCSVLHLCCSMLKCVVVALRCDPPRSKKSKETFLCAKRPLKETHRLSPDVKRVLLTRKATGKRVLLTNDFEIKFQARLLIWWLYSQEKKKRWRVIHDVTCSYTWYDSCMNVPWLIHTWHDALVYVVCGTRCHTCEWVTSHIWMSHGTCHKHVAWTREAHKRGPIVHDVRLECNMG